MNRVPSKQTFREQAEPIRIQLGEGRFIALPKVFSTGSFGWYHSGKMIHEFGGEPLTVQVSLSMVIVGSKNAPSLPGMTSAERLAEEEARRLEHSATMVSPLFPATEPYEKVRIDSKAPGIAQNASEATNDTDPNETGRNASGATPGASTGKRKRTKGGAK